MTERMFFVGWLATAVHSIQHQTTIASINNGMDCLRKHGRASVKNAATTFVIAIATFPTIAAMIAVFDSRSHLGIVRPTSVDAVRQKRLVCSRRVCQTNSVVGGIKDWRGALCWCLFS
jgi:hypothetical protein